MLVPYISSAKIDNAFESDNSDGNSDDAVDIPDDLIYGDESFSISAWAMFYDLSSSGGQRGSIVSSYGYNVDALSFRTGDTDGGSVKVNFQNGVADSESVRSGTLNEDQWYHIVFTYDYSNDKEMKLYINGNSEDSATNPDWTAPHS